MREAKQTTPSQKADRTVAEYLSSQIDICVNNGKTQREIATEAGFPKPNVITMLKQGITKVPTAKVASLSRALGIDSRFFLSMVLKEYYPEMWEVFEGIMQQPALTRNEIEMIELARKTNPNNPKIATDNQKQKFAELIKDLPHD